MFPLQSHVISLVIEFQAISVNTMARWIVFRYFTLSLHFTPGLQSAVCILPLVCILPPVCSLQSAVRSLRFTLTDYHIYLETISFYTVVIVILYLLLFYKKEMKDLEERLQFLHSKLKVCLQRIVNC